MHPERRGLSGDRNLAQTDHVKPLSPALSRARSGRWRIGSRENRILKFDLEGNFLYNWGVPGRQPGRLACRHGLSTDQDGNLYVADCFADRVQKFTPQPGGGSGQGDGTDTAIR